MTYLVPSFMEGETEAPKGRETYSRHGAGWFLCFGLSLPPYEVRLQHTKASSQEQGCEPGAGSHRVRILGPSHIRKQNSTAQLGMVPEIYVPGHLSSGYL